MPFCPQCRNEYIEGTRACEDCGVKLVPKLSRPSGRPPEGADKRRNEDLVEVWRTQGEMDGQLIRSLLDGNGIPSMLSGESLRLTHGFTVDGLALVKLLVRPEDARRACDVIASTEGVTQCRHCEFPVREGDTSCWSCGESLEG